MVFYPFNLIKTQCISSLLKLFVQKSFFSASHLFSVKLMIFLILWSPESNVWTFVLSNSFLFHWISKIQCSLSPRIFSMGCFLRLLICWKIYCCCCAEDREINKLMHFVWHEPVPVKNVIYIVLLHSSLSIFRLLYMHLIIYPVKHQFYGIKQRNWNLCGICLNHMLCFT